MRPLRTLHKGFDGFDVAFQGALNPDDIDILERARKQAEIQHQPALVDLGPGKVAMHVAESGSKGGYAFRCDTGPLGETWFFKRDLSRDGWNIRVSMKSQPLALLGLKEVWKQLQEKLNSLGIFSARESVGRIDFAIDFLMPSGFELQPNRFVAHAKATNAEHDYTIKPQKIAPDEFQVHWRGRVASSVTIGKMPGRQLIVYDKHQEVMQKRKFHWFEIWKLAEEEKTFPIFRVEVRAGKAHLKNWNVTTFEQLQTNIADILVSAVSSIRYVIENPEEENVSRWRPDRL